MARIIAAIVALAVLTLQPSRAFAAAEHSGLGGVWQGTLSGQPIRACFNQADGGSFGAYYYQAHLQTIALQQSDDEDRTFIEGLLKDDPKAPRWTLDKTKGDTLTGHWSAGARSLPISLSRVPQTKLKADETPCGSMLFHGPRLQGVHTVSKAAVKDGLHYSRLSLDLRGRFGDDVNVESFSLEGDSPAIRRINATLRKPLIGEPDGWLACVRQAWDMGPYGADSNETLKPKLVTRKWLTVMDQTEWDCGGAHPDAADVPRTFDLQTGAEIDLHDWLNAKAVKREHFAGLAEEAKELRPAFLNFILAGWKPTDEECGEPVRSEQFWRIELTRTGFTFTPELSRVVEPCIEPFTVSFAKLMPWLSAEGKRNVAAFQAEVAAKR